VASAENFSRQSSAAASAGVDPPPASDQLTGTAVFTVARQILEGSHAVPTRLKILLDRAMEGIPGEERRLILTTCGWNLEDYLRGYKLKDSSGLALDRWNMLGKAEEPLVLQQFMLFKETRTITQQLILQDLADRSNLQDIKPPTTNHSPQDKYKQELSEEASPVKCEGRGPSLLQLASNLHKREEDGARTPETPVSFSSPSPPAYSSPSAPPKANPMFSRNLSNGIPLPPTSIGMPGLPNLMHGSFPMFPFPGLSVSLPQTPPKETPRDLSGALNLSRPDKQAERNIAERENGIQEMESDTSSRRSSFDAESFGKRATMPDDIGITYVSPSTGKKRVQCNVCMKTFCDKGALKIHFSAVHLREMHKCTVSGCNMMFSSRRSRNRHSANPNPKLHTPQVKRRISQTDGRTHPGPITPLLPKEGLKDAFPMGAFPPAGMPQLPFPGLQGFNPFLPPDIKSFQKDLQRISDLQRLYQQNSEDSLRAREQDSDERGRTEEFGNRKRKSQNPTKRPHLDLEEEQVSSDSASDEGFPDPMMDDDDLDNVSSAGEEH